ncbi:transposase [Mesorhizobium sp. KR9-304]|uniref:transposase n=1 Tax=Mesorhizobium sp. KR9-304 TaxID=3156614 RepID=UPI0032B61687
MKGHAALWDVDERYARLSDAGDPPERLNMVVAWEMFRKPLAKAQNRPDRSQGGRQPYDAGMMFKALVLQALYGLSDEQAEFQIMDRRTFGRFLGRLVAGDRVDVAAGQHQHRLRNVGPTRRIGRIDQASSVACIARNQEAGR